jgi:hypothetical protein
MVMVKVRGGLELVAGASGMTLRDVSGLELQTAASCISNITIHSATLFADFNMNFSRTGSGY